MTRLSSAAWVAATALLVAGCGGEKSAQPSPPPPPPPPPPAIQPAQPPPPPTQPVLRTVRIVVQDGKVTGGLQQVTVSEGQRVAIVVTSDVADEVHLHGYDKSADAGPGKTARIVFVASIPGRFVVELEDRALQIADLEVRP